MTHQPVARAVPRAPMVTGYPETKDRDPYPFYEAIRTGQPHWDTEIKGWLVTDYAQCRHILGHEELFERADRYVPGGREIRVARAVSVLVGREHHVRHKALVSLIGGHAAEPYRERFVRPFAHRLIDRFISDGRAELSSQYANELPLRVGLASLGADPWDETTVSQIRRAGARMERYRADEHAADQAAIDEAVAGRAEIDTYLRALIAERKRSPGDDVITDVITRGPSYVPEWDDEDTLAAASAVYAGGEIRFALRQALFAVVDDPTRQPALRRQPGAASDFVEDVLRLSGPVHWMGRVAMKDVMVGATEIHQGDLVFAMLAAANLDPRVFPNTDVPGGTHPSNLPDHLAFGFGTRFCPGAALARLEIVEALEALLERCPDLAWDVDAPPPELRGFHVRSFSPLHVTFSRPSSVE